MKVWKQGGCHCGKVRFKVRSAFETALSCNCSICRKSAFLHLIVTKEDFELLGGQSELTCYQFESTVAQHLFCRYCGIKSLSQNQATLDFSPLGSDQGATTSHSGVYGEEEQRRAEPNGEKPFGRSLKSLNSFVAPRRHGTTMTPRRASDLRLLRDRQGSPGFEIGSKSFYVPRSHPNGYSVNLRCLDDLELGALKVSLFDGRNWEANIGKIN